MEPLSWVFYMLQYFETFLPSVENLWSSQQDVVLFISDDAARRVTLPTMVVIFDFNKN